MSVTYRISPENSASCQFVFEGKIPVLPTQIHEFTNEDQATKAGVHIAATICRDPRVARVQTYKRKTLDENNNDSSLWDCVEVILKQGSSWGDIAKSSAAQFTQNTQVSAPKTAAETYRDILQNRYFDGNKAIYSKLGIAGNDADMLQRIFTHIKDSFSRASSSKEELNQKIKAGGRATVYDTIKIDTGNAEVKSLTGGVLTIRFSGNCGSNCVNKSTTATEIGLRADLKQHFPFIQQFSFEKI